MKVEQIYSTLNTIVKETLGESAVVQEDLSNIVQIGEALYDTNQVDNYVRKLIDHIGKIVFVNRSYSGRAPSVLMEDWEYGSIMEKIDADIPDAVENPSWNLQDGQHYEQDTFHAPKGVTVKFFNGEVTFEVIFSISRDTVKESFDNITQLNAFFSMIENKINIRFTLDTDALIMRTINNFIGLTINDLTTNGGTTAAGGIRAINLLALYNAENTNKLTVANALNSLDFIKFASYYISEMSDRLEVASRLFNIGKRVRFTPKNLQHIIMLSQFVKRADVYLQSDTFHNEMTKLPKAERVAYWQGSGQNYAFVDASSIDIVANDGSQNGVAIKQSGILAVIFDRDALAVNRYRRRTTTHYNANGDFINNFYKMNARYYNDTNENFIVFYIEDEPAPNPGV